MIPGGAFLKYCIDFIGYGEAAYNISKGLQSVRKTPMIAFDIQSESPERGELIRSRMAEVGVDYARTAEEAIADCKYIITFTSPAFSYDVAKNLIGKLKPGQIYLDMNSTAPTTMEAIDKLPRPDGVRFCDVSLLDNIAAGKHLTKMLICGEGGKEFLEFISDYTPNARYLDTPIGSASAVKMFKSVFSKGLPQLLIECLVPAAEYGVYNLVFEGVKDTFKTRTLEQFGDNVVYRTLIHSKRRAAEMKDVSVTLESMGFGAEVSRAVEKRLRRLAEYGYPQKIGQTAPNLREVVEMVRQDDRLN